MRNELKRATTSERDDETATGDARPMRRRRLAQMIATTGATLALDQLVPLEWKTPVALAAPTINGVCSAGEASSSEDCKSGGEGGNGSGALTPCDPAGAPLVDNAGMTGQVAFIQVDVGAAQSCSAVSGEGQTEDIQFLLFTVPNFQFRIQTTTKILGTSEGTIDESGGTYLLAGFELDTIVLITCERDGTMFDLQFALESTGGDAPYSLAVSAIEFL